jgi:hypothetical protein
MTAIQLPDPSVVSGLERLARTELSLRARLGHVLLALVASAMTIVVVSLWMTEPALPTRTATAFAMLTVIGLGWVAYSIWVLQAKRVMLARQRVIAGRLAFLFASAFTLGCLALAFTTTVSAAWPAFAMSLVMLVLALGMWRRAEAVHATLMARRETLERELAQDATH